MLRVQLCVYTAESKQYKQSRCSPELPNFTLASGYRARMEIMGNEQRQRHRMKTRTKETKRNFSRVAAMGDEERNTDEL